VSDPGGRGAAAKRQGRDLAGAFGGMGSQTVFGPRGSATVLSKATTISAVLFHAHFADACRLWRPAVQRNPGSTQEDDPVTGK
jgi:hypothetical protein